MDKKGCNNCVCNCCERNTLNHEPIHNVKDVPEMCNHCIGCSDYNRHKGDCKNQK